MVERYPGHCRHRPPRVRGVDIVPSHPDLLGPRGNPRFLPSFLVSGAFRDGSEKTPGSSESVSTGSRWVGERLEPRPLSEPGVERVDILLLSSLTQMDRSTAPSASVVVESRGLCENKRRSRGSRSPKGPSRFAPKDSQAPPRLSGGTPWPVEVFGPLVGTTPGSFRGKGRTD